MLLYEEVADCIKARIGTPFGREVTLLEGGIESVDVELEAVSSQSSDSSLFAGSYKLQQCAPREAVKTRKELERHYCKSRFPLSEVSFL